MRSGLLSKPLQRKKLLNCTIYTLVGTLFYRKLCRRRSPELFPDNRHLARLTTIEEFIGLLCLFDWKPMRHHHFWMGSQRTRCSSRSSICGRLHTHEPHRVNCLWISRGLGSNVTVPPSPT